MNPLSLAFYLRGILLGLAIAAPVGPIGVLCIRRTLTSGRLLGFVTGLGAATADGTYGAVAAFGLTFVSGFLLREQGLVRLIGGLALCWLGARTVLRAKVPEVALAGAAETPTNRAKGLLTAYASTLFLTLANPTTILSFVAIFAGLGLVSVGSNTRGAAASLVLGVFSGSALWWLALSTGIGLLRGWFTPARLAWVNRASGLLLLAFGLVALASLVP